MNPKYVQRIGLSLLLAGLTALTLAIFFNTADAAMSSLSSPAQGNLPALPPSLRAGTVVTHEIFLPVVMRCYIPSGRPPLQNTGNYAGDITIDSPTSCALDLRAGVPTFSG